MDATLFRYWFVPKRWRLWSDGKRFGFMAFLFLVVGGLSFLPLLLLPARIGEGFDGYWAQLLGLLFFLVVNVACALAGAPLITREYELGSWESLVLTAVGMPRIVRFKWLARTLFAMGSIGIFVPFWLLLTSVVLYLNDGEDRAYYTKGGHLPHTWSALRLGIFLLWLAIRIPCHAIPFVTLGAFISACCRKTRRAIGITLTSVVLLQVALILLYLASMGGNVFVTSTAKGSEAFHNFFLRIGLLWPFLPNSYDDYSAHSLLSKNWQNDLTGDVVWILVVPAALLFFTLRLCRRTERTLSHRKVKQIPHGV